MIRLIIPIALILAIDLYFFQAVKAGTIDLAYSVRMLSFSMYWLLNILAIGGIIIATQGEMVSGSTRYYLFSVLLVLIIPKLIGSSFLILEDLFRFGSGLLSLLQSNNETFMVSRRKFVSQAALVTATIPFISMIYGMAVTAFKLSVRKTALELPDLPGAFHGLRIVQISDLHCGSFASDGLIKDAVNQILELKPDLIFFTGDLVNNKAIEAEPYLEHFKRLKARLGVYSILGNHDYGDYGPWPSREVKAANLDRLKQIHEESGWHLLLNDSSSITIDGETLAIVGVENWGASRHFPKYGDLDKAVSNVSHIPFKILLSHDPSHWEAQVKDHPEKFQVTFSGHTHGFQFGIEIPGFKWSPVQYVYKQWAGLYGDGGQHLYVNRGLGFIGYMGRVGISPEITQIELKSAENS